MPAPTLLFCSTDILGYAFHQSAAAGNFFRRDIPGLEMVIEFAEFFSAKSDYFWVNWHRGACTLKVSARSDYVAKYENCLGD